MMGLSVQVQPIYSVNMINEAFKTYPKEIVEFFILQKRNKIIDDVVQQIFDVSATLPDSCLTAQEIGNKIKRTYSQENQTAKSLNTRQLKFRAYLAQEVLSVLKGRAPFPLRQDILKAMEPEDKKWIELKASQHACQLLEQLDGSFLEIVNDLLNKVSDQGSNQMTQQENKEQN